MDGISVTEKCRRASMLMGIAHPHFLLIHSKLKYIEQSGKDSVGTMGITDRGVVYLDQDFVAKLDRDELAGVMAHEMLHLVLLHHGRMASRDPRMWNVAADMCINKALISDGIKLPQKALMPPNEYQGDLYTEALYEWLQNNPNKWQQQPNKKKGKGQKGSGQPQPGSGGEPGDGDPSEGDGSDNDLDRPNPTEGCGVIPDKGDGKKPGEEESDVPDWRKVALEATAQAKMAGKGASAVAHLLSPREPKINWKKILRHGVSLACARPARDYQTFSKKNRRSPAEGIQMPGWRGTEPNVAVIIDASGSMDRKWIDLIVSECKNLMKSFSGMNMYLCTHTSEVVWEGWVTANATHKLVDAVQFSGGTDPQPAYDAVEKAGKFDTVIHFTDCYFMDTKWPRVPAKHLVVGAFAREIYTKPPPGAHVIMCSFDED